ncbi:MAG TPA: HEAT repeat domain-containing protein, partial [Burkholderiaceae bacterium]
MLTMDQRLADPDAAVRRLAVMDLPYSDEAEIAPLLLPRLRDDDPGVRAEAVKALEGDESPAVVAALAARL